MTTNKPTVFGPEQLREELIRVFGEHGAHVEVFDMLTDRIKDCEKAGQDLLPILGKHNIPCPPSFIALDSPISWMEWRKERK